MQSAAALNGQTGMISPGQAAFWSSSTINHSTIFISYPQACLENAGHSRRRGMKD
jgi:hypothetical protein